MRCVCFRCISNYVYANETTTTRSQQQSFIFWDDDNNDAAAVILISRKRTGNMKNSKKINFNWTMNVLYFFYFILFLSLADICFFTSPSLGVLHILSFLRLQRKYSKFLSIFLESFSGILPVCRWWIYEIMLPILRLFFFCYCYVKVLKTSNNSSSSRLMGLREFED